MGALGERTLMLLLTDTDSVTHMAREGLPPQVIPTIKFRDIYAWTLDYYQRSGAAPTVPVLHERFGPDFFNDHQIDLTEDVEETIEWAIGDLRQSYLKMEIGLYTRRLATETATANPDDVVDVVSGLAADLSGLVQTLQPRTTHADLRESGPAILAEYQSAVDSRGVVRGMSLGIPEIDEHTGGIWDGELAIMGGPAGIGKSFFADFVAYKEWERGRCVTLYTLENSILMTQMRIACQALMINAEDLQTGNLSEDNHKALVEWCNDVLVKADNPLNIVNPESQMRSPQALIQTARAHDTDSLIIDQLTFMRPLQEQEARHREIGVMLHDLKEMISTGRHTMPCLLMHQINREGIKAANATGRLHMTHMAEGAEVERTGDHVMSLFATEQEREHGRMQIQTLKARRVKPRHWQMVWHPYSGIIQYTNDVQFDDDV